MMADPVIKASIDAYTRDIERMLDGFTKGPRKQILRKGAAIVRKSARAKTPKRKNVTRGRRGNKKTFLNPRYSNGKIVALYAPGNLRRSVQTLSLNKSNDVFVGPRFGAKKPSGIIGRKVSTADGYYAAMVYGSANAFFNRVLGPALNQNRLQVLAIIRKESRKKLVQFWVQLGRKAG